MGTFCALCGGRCRLDFDRAEIVETVTLCRQRLTKARNEENYFRMQWWEFQLNLALDHLVPA